LDRFASRKEGRLKIIANAPQPALAIIATFKARFPGIHIDFGLHDWTTAIKMIRNRLADVGLITEAPVSEDWDRVLLQRSRYVAYCKSDHPLANRASIHLSELLDDTSSCRNMDRSNGA